MSWHVPSVISLNKPCAAATRFTLVADLRQVLRPSQQALGPRDLGGYFETKRVFLFSGPDQF